MPGVKAKNVDRFKETRAEGVYVYVHVPPPYVGRRESAGWRVSERRPTPPGWRAQLGADWTRLPAWAMIGHRKQHA